MRNSDVATVGRGFTRVEQVLPENVDARLRVVLNWCSELAGLEPAESR